MAPAGDACPDGDAGEIFDVAIIGAGVIGCALARRFTLEGARVVLIEKAADVLDGASKGNSAILHTGFDAPPGSVEAACIAEGYREYLEIRARLNLPLLKTGALVVAWTDDEAATLPDLIAQARENGVDDVAPLTEAETRRLEPELGPGVRAAFRVPREYVIDPWSAPHAYLRQAVENGARLMTSAPVTAGTFDGRIWRVETPRGTVRAGLVINAAGLWGDRVDDLLIGATDFTIRPRKGQFVVYDKPAAALARHILLPVPNKVTKGIVVCRTAFGNLLVGPTAEEQEDRERAGLVPETLNALIRRGTEILPALKDHEVTAIYAGLRPATEFKDYRIRVEAAQRYVTVGGIRSTGLSSALGTAAHVHRLTAGLLAGHRPVADPVWPRMPMLAEDETRDWQCPGNGGVVCHCERVTRREIEAALDGPTGARSLAGLKRRTRVTMGRCQGFYCSQELAAITAGRLAVPMTADPTTAPPAAAGGEA
ncbi:NAD(P)/FAD-dependent oxidoreductase [Tistrella mobilis]|uniref:NAD(P)/FAD-dependent oxidoreductase n=1 Tax=Tistrella mobilis TaxID=171437 RepID=UPI0035575056